MKKFAVLAIAALVGATAFANELDSQGYGWWLADGQTGLTIGGVTTDFTQWSTNPDSPKDIGPLTDLTITAASFSYWSDKTDRGGADMWFILWDGGSEPIGTNQKIWLGANTTDNGHDRTVVGDVADGNLLSGWSTVSLTPNKDYYLDMWMETYPDTNPDVYNAGGANYHAKFQIAGTTPPAGVPEPATMSLLGLGALAMVIRRKLSK